MDFSAYKCDSTTHSQRKASSEQGSALLGLLGIDLTDLNVLLGLDCSPITAVGVGSGNTCNTNTVSCSNGIVVCILDDFIICLSAHSLSGQHRYWLRPHICLIVANRSGSIYQLVCDMLSRFCLINCTFPHAMNVVLLRISRRPRMPDLERYAVIYIKQLLFVR
jgi:hypothetical protein